MPIIGQISAGVNASLYLWKTEEGINELKRSVRLNADEENAFNSYTHDFRKVQWLSVRALLSQVLPNEVIRYDEHGKPWLVSGSKHISVSHTGNYIALMCADTACGVDIELQRDTIERISKRFLSEKELAQIRGSDRIRHLHYYWSIKEAAYKMNGRKNVSLREDIFVHPFEPADEGNAMVSLYDSGTQHTINACFRNMNELIIGWTKK